MVMLNLSLRSDTEELRIFFIEFLGEIGFIVIHKEEWRDGFRVIGASAKRTSQLTATLMNLFIGYIHRNRIAIELVAHQENGLITATLKGALYLDVVDLEAPDENPEEKERCERLTTLFYDRIQEKYGRNS